jgi:hypothetical protein
VPLIVAAAAVAESGVSYVCRQLPVLSSSRSSREAIKPGCCAVPAVATCCTLIQLLLLLLLLVVVVVVVVLAVVVVLVAVVLLVLQVLLLLVQVHIIGRCVVGSYLGEPLEAFWHLMVCHAVLCCATVSLMHAMRCSMLDELDTTTRSTGMVRVWLDPCAQSSWLQVS